MRARWCVIVACAAALTPAAACSDDEPASNGATPTTPTSGPPADDTGLVVPGADMAPASEMGPGGDMSAVPVVDMAPADLGDDGFPPADMAQSPDAMDGGQAADPLAALSDEFDDPATLSSWSRLWQTESWPHDQLETYTIEAGHLVMEPYSSGWFRDYRGVLAYKAITGDFVVTARVQATNRARDGAPSRSYSLAGILIRTPRNVTLQTWTRGGENYVFLSLGTGDAPGTFQSEVKTTTDSTSRLVLASAPGDTAEIRIARLGATVVTMLRFPGQPWQVHRRYDRGDMPAQLQVGLTAYTDWPSYASLEPEDHNTNQVSGNPDLHARYDYIRFATPRPAPGADPATMSDAELLGFLGFD